jgi:hypothetical protein
MTQDIRELRDKVVALTNVVESREAKYRLHEMEERLTELLRLSSEREAVGKPSPS